MAMASPGAAVLQLSSPHQQGHGYGHGQLFLLAGRNRRRDDPRRHLLPLRSIYSVASFSTSAGGPSRNALPVSPPFSSSLSVSLVQEPTPNLVSMRAFANDAVVVVNHATTNSSDTLSDMISQDASVHPVPEEASASTFLADVVSLIKLVDSRDITELELKNVDFEIVIRKKEAIVPPPSPPPAQVPPPLIPQQTYAKPAPIPQSPVAPSPPPPAPSNTSVISLPPMLSPMAGTLYRSPAPGEPAFVKVGDKVQKGQIICIIEAMKLMNEIEADRTGTIVEILAEDGKPVAIDSPIMVIKP